MLFTHFYFTYFTTAFAIFLKQEKFSSRKLIGSMTAFVGAALVLVAGHSLTSSFYGNGIGLITSICWGLYPVLAGPLIKNIQHYVLQHGLH